MNPRPLGPEPSALPTALHPERKKPQQLRCCGVARMRGSNSHGRSQSPLHYHYANPHRNHRCGRLPSTLIYYSVWGNRLSTAISNFLQKSVKIRKSAQLRLTFLSPPACTNCSCWRKRCARTPTQGTAIDSDHTDAQNTNAMMVTYHIPFQLVCGGVVLITAGDA